LISNSTNKLKSGKFIVCNTIYEEGKIFSFCFVFLVGGFCFCLFSEAYEPMPTHASLAEKSTRLFNQFYQGNLSEKEIQEIIQGAINEDTPPRWINHFYLAGLIISMTQLLAKVGLAKEWTRFLLQLSVNLP
jgi:hypothetical protein